MLKTHIIPALMIAVGAVIIARGLFAALRVADIIFTSRTNNDA